MSAVGSVVAQGTDMSVESGIRQKNSNSRKKPLTLLLWLLALSLAAWTLRQLPLDNIASQLALLSPRDWSLWFLVNVAILYLAVKRWQLLSQALQVPLSLRSLFRLRQAGSTISFLTPGPQFGGEPLQLYWMHRHYATPIHRAVAALGLDRFMETGINIAVLLGGVSMLLGTTLLPVQEWLAITAVLAGVLCAMLMAAAVLLRHPEWLARRCSPFTQGLRAALAARRGKEGRTVGSGETDLQEEGEGGWLTLVNLLRGAFTAQKSTLWLALLLSLAGWSALLIELSMLLGFLGLVASPIDIVLVMVSMRLAMLLPVPGGIGTIEASLLWSFQYIGFPTSAAVGLIALIRMRDALVFIMGLGCLFSFYGRASDSKSALAE